MQAARSILIVDDNRALAENLKEIFEDEDFATEVAVDGLSALAMLAKRDFSLVITDIRMPGMSGVEMLKAIQERWPCMSVIVMTAYSSDALLQEAAAAGALGVLSKPIDMEQMIGLVRRAAEPSAPVLLIEDERELRVNLAECLLDIAGVVPHVAGDIATAERLAARCQFRVAIIDVRLPDGNGLEYGLRLQAQLGDEATIIYITGFEHELEDMLGERGSRPQIRLLAKPFTPQALLDLVRGVI